ncbi:MAG TPA: isochorismate synthase [Pasteurellaceae bacterium]|nr:isochorismate synthase [Pasteurellaceae bacterium]
MDSLQSLYLQLSQQLNAYRPEDRSLITALQAESALHADLLAWLKAQPSYPQFYLHLREGEQKWGAIGEVLSFTDTNHAQDFVRQQQLPLLGGLTFDKQADFFLPRVLLQQSKQSLRATIFIDNRQDPETEKQAVLAVLKTFTNLTALEPIRQPVRFISQQAEQQQWCNWVEQALKKIQQGELSKVVLANESRFETENPLNGCDFLAESERQNTGCYHFLFARNAERTFLGSTPERLYLRRKQRLETEALAGTAMMNGDAQQNQAAGDWLLHDEKNVHENWLVAEGICRQLNQYADNIEIAALELKKLRQLQHLRRKILVELNPNCEDKDCLAAIHPTAAVSGLPPQAAMQFLQNTENFDRTWYAGTLGIIQPDQAEFCVTIRSAIIERNKITVFAGAGIVEGSVPLLEWQEIERKALGLVSLLNTKVENTEH